VDITECAKAGHPPEIGTGCANAFVLAEEAGGRNQGHENERAKMEGSLPGAGQESD